MQRYVLIKFGEMVQTMFFSALSGLTKDVSTGMPKGVTACVFLKCVKTFASDMYVILEYHIVVK
jgi:hypothetical protein